MSSVRNNADINRNKWFNVFSAVTTAAISSICSLKLISACWNCSYASLFPHGPAQFPNMATCTRTLLKGQLLSVIFCPTDAWPLFVLEDSLFPTRRRGYFPCIYTASLASLLAGVELCSQSSAQHDNQKSKPLIFLFLTVETETAELLFQTRARLSFFNSFIVATFKH